MIVGIITVKPNSRILCSNKRIDFNFFLRLYFFLLHLEQVNKNSNIKINSTINTLLNKETIVILNLLSQYITIKYYIRITLK